MPPSRFSYIGPLNFFWHALSTLSLGHEPRNCRPRVKVGSPHSIYGNHKTVVHTISFQWHSVGRLEDVEMGNSLSAAMLCGVTERKTSNNFLASSVAALWRPSAWRFMLHWRLQMLILNYYSVQKSWREPACNQREQTESCHWMRAVGWWPFGVWVKIGISRIDTRAQQPCR